MALNLKIELQTCTGQSTPRYTSFPLRENSHKRSTFVNSSPLFFRVYMHRVLSPSHRSHFVYDHPRSLADIWKSIILNLFQKQIQSALSRNIANCSLTLLVLKMSVDLFSKWFQIGLRTFEPTWFTENLQHTNQIMASVTKVSKGNVKCESSGRIIVGEWFNRQQERFWEWAIWEWVIWDWAIWE